MLALPGLTGCEDDDHAVPVLVLELLLGASDQNEAHWAARIKSAHYTHLRRQQALEPSFP